MQAIPNLLSINIIADVLLIKYRNHANFKKKNHYPPLFIIISWQRGVVAVHRK